MQIFRQVKCFARDLITKIAIKIAPVRWKEFGELRYWRGMKEVEGELSNEHYEYFYTTHFGLDSSYYKDMVILDIGCGPRGSLEWASMASRCIGLDPLAEEYLRLGASKHRMEYIGASSEKIPLKDAECGAVFSFNSLDHVQDVGRTLREIKRVTRPGGLFLLLVEVNHPPTVCEPHELTPGTLIDYLKPEFDCESLQVYKPDAQGIYQSIYADKKIPFPVETREVGYLSAKFRRITSS